MLLCTCVHCSARNRKLSIHTPIHAHPPAQILVFMGPLMHVCTCPKATPKAVWSCRSGDPQLQEETERLSDDATPPSRCWEHAGSQGRMVFFHQINPPPHPSSWKPGPGASMCHTLGGASTSPHVFPQSSNLCCFQIRSLCPGKLWSWFIGSNRSRPCPKAVAGSFGSSFSTPCCGLGFFYPPKALKVLLLYHWVLPANAEDTLDARVVLSTKFSLCEASQTCRDETTLPLGYSGTRAVKSERYR